MRNSCLTQKTSTCLQMLPLLSVLGVSIMGNGSQLHGLQSYPTNPSSSTALFEIYPVVAAAVLWGHTWSRSRSSYTRQPGRCRHHKELQTLGPRCRSTSHAGSSIFGVDILHTNPVTVPLIIASSNMILNSLSPATLSSYWSAWKRFRQFHLQYNITFSSFDLVTLTSFITHAHSALAIKIHTIKGYLCRISFANF